MYKVELRGRKRGIFLFSIGQTAYTEKAIRDAQLQFFSSMAFAIKSSAARSAGFTNTPLLNRLYAERRPGQFLLERPQGDALLLAPHVDYRAIPHFLQVRDSAVSPTEPEAIDSDWKDHRETELIRRSKPKQPKL